MRHKVLTIVLLLGIIILGTFIRIENISPFKIYPDSYQNLITAANIQTYQSVVGYLGEEGMIYPPFFLWSRPVFPLLILLFNPFFHSPAQTAQILVVFFGIAAIPLSYLLIRHVFHHTTTALVGAFLLTVSYFHVVWSGFIMTETIGVVMQLLLFISLFTSRKNQPAVAAIVDITSGVLYALALLTRFEYSLMLLPIMYLALRTYPNPIHRLCTIFVTAGIVVTAVFVRLFPIASLFAIIVDQLSDVIFRGVLITGVVMLGSVILFVVRNKWHKQSEKTINQLLQILLIAFVSYLFLQMMFPFLPLNDDFTMLRMFLLRDPLIALATVIGIYLMLRTQHTAILSHVVLLSATSLFLLYHRINPFMDRYITHLLPGFLIAASFGVNKSLHMIMPLRKQKQSLFQKGISLAVAAVFVCGIILQLTLSLQGLRLWTDASWFQQAYEETTAQTLARLKLPPDTVLITSFPEPYFLATHQTTHSVTDTAPFLYLPDSLNKKTAVIVLDQGMRDLFPKFSAFVTQNLAAYRTQSVPVSGTYHYAHRSIRVTEPVVSYTIPVRLLLEKTAQAQGL
jgi:hypothetical protein